MFERILVPLDGSPLAERAVAHAERFAKVFGSSLVLLQVLDPSPFRESPGMIDPLNWQIRKTEADIYEQGVAAGLRERGVRVEYAIREGRPAENIVDFAHSEKIDLLVLSTHGASGLSRWNSSSVAGKVIEKIYLPMLLVRAFTGPDRESSLALAAQSAGAAQSGAGLEKPASAPPTTITGEEVHYRHILLPIDRSRRAECALPAATMLVEGEPDASLLMAAVVQPPDLPIPTPYPEEIQTICDRLLQLSRTAANDYLKELQARVPAGTDARVIERDNISSAIHELAEPDEIDMVILCAHGKTGGTSWPYGSVARNYIEHGTKTTLVIQDVPRAQVRPTVVELAAEKYGRR